MSFKPVILLHAHCPPVASQADSCTLKPFFKSVKFNKNTFKVWFVLNLKLKVFPSIGNHIETKAGSKSSFFEFSL